MTAYINGVAQRSWQPSRGPLGSSQDGETSDICIAQDRAARLEREALRDARRAAAAADGFSLMSDFPQAAPIGAKVAIATEFGCARYARGVEFSDAWGNVRGEAFDASSTKVLVDEAIVHATETGKPVQGMLVEKWIAVD